MLEWRNQFEWENSEAWVLSKVSSLITEIKEWIHQFISPSVKNEHKIPLLSQIAQYGRIKSSPVQKLNFSHLLEQQIISEGEIYEAVEQFLEKKVKHLHKLLLTRDTFKKNWQKVELKMSLEDLSEEEKEILAFGIERQILEGTQICAIDFTKESLIAFIEQYGNKKLPMRYYHKIIQSCTN